eukprot:1483944-Rhodomonas_salina.1
MKARSSVKSKPHASCDANSPGSGRHEKTHNDRQNTARRTPTAVQSYSANHTLVVCWGLKALTVVGASFLLKNIDLVVEVKWHLRLVLMLLPDSLFYDPMLALLDKLYRRFVSYQYPGTGTRIAAP